MLWCVPQVGIIERPCVTVNYNHWLLKPFGGDLNTAKEHYLQGRKQAVSVEAIMIGQINVKHVFVCSQEVNCKCFYHTCNNHRHFFMDRSDLDSLNPESQLTYTYQTVPFHFEAFFFPCVLYCISVAKHRRTFNQEIITSVGPYLNHLPGNDGDHG